MAVGRHQVKSPVVVDIEKRDPETEAEAAGHGQTDNACVVGENASAQVPVKRRVFVKKIGDRQIRPAVARP